MYKKKASAPCEISQRLFRVEQYTLNPIGQNVAQQITNEKGLVLLHHLETRVVKSTKVFFIKKKTKQVKHAQLFIDTSAAPRSFDQQNHEYTFILPR